MRVAVLLVAIALAAGCFGDRGSGPDAKDPPEDAPIGGFLPHAIIDETLDGREPYLAVDPDGRLFVTAMTGTRAFPYVSRLWMSEDDGASWTVLDANPALPTGQGLGGGDSAIAIGPQGEVYVADLWGQSMSVSTSTDHGRTWRTVPVSSAGAADDRQWMAVDPQGRAYLIARDAVLGSAQKVTRSDDQGATWRTVGFVWTFDPLSEFPEGIGTCIRNGNLAVGPDGSLHTPFLCGPESLHLHVATSRDAGATWTRTLVSERPAFAGNHWPMIAADDAGTLYVAWIEDGGNGHQVWVASSVDGAVWSAPSAIPLPPAARLFPWIAADAAGTVAIAWYEADRIGNPDSAKDMDGAAWSVRVALTREGASAAPAWVVLNATDAPIHRGTLSNSGNSPEGEAPDRSLGDFLSLGFGPDGTLRVAFAVGSRDEGPPHVAFARMA